MSYRISYGPKTPKKYYKNKKANKLPLYAAVAGILITVMIAFPAQVQTLKHKLLPWTTPESKAAITAMLADIEDGVSYEEAITAFCREIINGAIDES